ncbi:MAG TPA: glycosyltransferase [Acidimicrobiales bacterium]|nr:glycosyltransferase [Acidimicrobiales bacterium]
MPLLQRFDEDTVTPLTPEELKSRWVHFHQEIRRLSGTRLQRVAGRMLGEDTWRYKTARTIFRPPLRAWRKWRKKEKTRPTLVSAAQATEIYPVNYRPRVTDYSLEYSALNADLSDVVIVEVPRDTEARAVIESLNTTLNETTAEWFFLCDSEVTSDARNYSAARLLAHATSGDDVVFADEAGPNQFAPILKSPGVGPHTLLSYNVVGRPALWRVETLFAAGGFSLDAGWTFEHDAYLRLSERGATFHHLARVLPAGRSARDFEADRIDDDSVRVVQAALARRGWRGTAALGERAGLVRWTLDAPSPAPSIDIIIPTRDRIDLVRQCIDAIEEQTTYPNYSIILLDNDSVEEASLAYFRETKYRVVPCPGPFNYAKIVNRGVNHSSADYIVTLNNDTVVVTPDWLEQLISLASLEDVGIVGACLLDRDGRREHESIVISPYPQHLRTDSNYPHADNFSLAVRDVAAVTGAVQMVEREFWQHLGGMDEQLAVVMNDVDICLRAQIEGRYVIYTPHVRLYHHVGSSRGDLDPLEDRNRFISRWDIFGSFRDPYFPESLLLLGEKMYFFVR